MRALPARTTIPPGGHGRRRRWREETSLAEVAGPVVRRARSASKQRIDVDLPESLPLVLADSVLLEQVLTNLLDNARRYAAGSPIALVARERGEVVELRVINRGPGIPVPERERVFDQFYRLKGGGRRRRGPRREQGPGGGR